MATNYGIKSIAIRDYELLPSGIAGTRADNGKRVEWRESQIQDVAYGSEDGVTTAWVRPTEGPRCFCPGDCHCHFQGAPYYRYSYCGCRAHETN